MPWNLEMSQAPETADEIHKRRGMCECWFQLNNIRWGWLWGEVSIREGYIDAGKRGKRAEVLIFFKEGSTNWQAVWVNTPPQFPVFILVKCPAGYNLSPQRTRTSTRPLITYSPRNQDKNHSYTNSIKHCTALLSSRPSDCVCVLFYHIRCYKLRALRSCNTPVTTALLPAGHVVLLQSPVLLSRCGSAVPMTRTHRQLATNWTPNSQYSSMTPPPGAPINWTSPLTKAGITFYQSISF
jgi:hypothetical protein